MNLTMPSVEIIIPTFNRCGKLRLALSSALNQSYPNLTVHVLDNCSSDGTSDYIQALMVDHPNIKYTRSDANAGALENFRKGFAGVTSDFFSLLSDDDVLLPYFVHELVDAINLSECEFAVGQTIHLDGFYQLASPCIPGKSWSLFKDAPKIFPDNVPIVWTAMLFPRRMANLFLDAHMKYEIGADMRFLALAMASHSYVYVPKPYAFMVHHDGSYSSGRSMIEEGRLYHVVQLHRYVEVLSSPLVKDDDKQLYRKSLKYAMRKPVIPSWFTYALSLLFRAWESRSSPASIDRFESELVNLAKEDELLLVFILKAIFKSSVIKSLYFLALHLCILPKRRARSRFLKSLENSVLSEEFALLRKLRAAPPPPPPPALL